MMENNVTGALCMKKPWPGMARTIYGSHGRFLDTYFRPYKGFYFTGDGAIRHGDGHYQITGRMDDVINVSGHRLGTAEVEDALVNPLLLLKNGYDKFINFGFFRANILRWRNRLLSVIHTTSKAKESMHMSS